MVNLKQEFELYDYLGPLAVALAFAIIVLLLSFFLLNFFLISKHDEVTVFERPKFRGNSKSGLRFALRCILIELLIKWGFRFGSRLSVRLGPHSLDSIKRRKQRQAELEAEQQSSKLTGTSKRASGNVPIIQIPQVKIDDASS